jgi:hypothetical protein
MQRLQKMPDKDKEFQAPQWVLDESDPTKNSVPQVITPKQKLWLQITIFVAIPFCLWAGWFEFGRAQSGNWRAWVYTFEWPFFAFLAIYLYRRLTNGKPIKIPRPDLEKLARLAEEDAGKEKQ